MKIVGLTRTKSGRGFADIIIKNGGNHDVYEIKSDQYEFLGRYNAAAINQLDSYVNAITNYPVENANYYPARKAQGDSNSGISSLPFGSNKSNTCIYKIQQVSWSHFLRDYESTAE